MKEVLSGQDIKRIFANFSGHLHHEGHQLLARALCAKIQLERAALGIPAPGVTVAEKPQEAKTAAPAGPAVPHQP
jgi:hypothetical protein